MKTKIVVENSKTRPTSWSFQLMEPQCCWETWMMIPMWTRPAGRASRAIRRLPPRGPPHVITEVFKKTWLP
ncbi:hypothetical protein CRENBAI_002534 [Crenichthys baileyi]|uniref:Uncharacterized protein n=1 Tax=Crenichthys baileyi TaxID=28760 RepID=A0AAV9SG66_9TELE